MKPGANQAAARPDGRARRRATGAIAERGRRPRTGWAGAFFATAVSVSRAICRKRSRQKRVGPEEKLRRFMDDETAIACKKFSSAVYQAIFACTLAISAATMAATDAKKAIVTAAKKMVIMSGSRGLIALRVPL